MNGYTFDITKTSVHAFINYDTDQASGYVPAYFIELLDPQGFNVGYVDVIRTDRGHWETHMFLDPEERNKGLGIQLLSKTFDLMLKRKLPLMSSTYFSADAARLWESKTLNELYEIEKVQAYPALHQRENVKDAFTDEPKSRRQHQYKLKAKRDR